MPSFGNSSTNRKRCLVTLEREGLIVRTSYPAVAAGTRAADVVERQVLSTLSAKEAKVLRDMLKRCAAALEDDPSRT